MLGYLAWILKDDLSFLKIIQKDIKPFKSLKNNIWKDTSEFLVAGF